VDDREGQPAVRGFLHRAEHPSGDVLVVTHGASGNCRGPMLVTLAECFAAAGVTVLRYDLPYRQARASGPPSPASAARDQAGIRRAVMLMKERRERTEWGVGGRVFAGGQSYGGRQTTMVAAAEPAFVDGLLLLSYPLHPPGRPAQLRTAHFPDLRAPALFVSGTADAFGSIDEIEAAVKLIRARVEIVPVPGASHSLVTKGNKDTLAATIVERFRVFFGASR